MKNDNLKLNLLNPLQLPTTLSPDSETNNKILKTLELIQIVITESDTDQNLDKLIEAMVILGETQQSLINNPITETFLSLEEIEDYDNYFMVNHCNSENIAISIVSSIVLAMRELLLLSKLHNFNHEELLKLKQGYQEYINLLFRTFNLSEE
ncbi:hypothetical protein [Aphanothece sacrum]|uniref:Transposase n=1 Tax=Aphanothece sacrum FPU1 TaxID=1920663 RepID=A0A401IHZ2_APHSA|nr:hypothetical protein [Aphanothece sacrum]GBF80864.1 transposase [Aphanothece sacrum FPU1]GBF85172.1 transposase [Aphanothece sacrum FPU3]